MAQISLINRPGAFKKKVSIPVCTGGTADVTLTMKYRTRTELGKLTDEYTEHARKRMQSMFDDAKAEFDAALAKYEAEVQAAKDAGEKPPTTPRPELKPLAEVTLADEINQAGAEYILKVAEDWDLDLPFTPENVQTLVDMYPAAAATIAKTYNEILKDGRLGN
jgi:hypothetical protein